MECQSARIIIIINNLHVCKEWLFVLRRWMMMLPVLGLVHMDIASSSRRLLCLWNAIIARRWWLVSNDRVPSVKVSTSHCCRFHGWFTWHLCTYSLLCDAARTGQEGTENILRERRLHWLSHVILMDYRCIRQQALYWEVLEFKRGPGQPRTNWRGAVIKDVQRLEVTWDEREGVAVYRQGCHQSVA